MGTVAGVGGGGAKDDAGGEEEEERGPKMSGRRNGGRSLVRTQWEPNQIGAPSERVEPADEPEAVWVPVVCAIELQGGRTKAGLIRGEGGIGGKNGRKQMALHL